METTLEPPISTQSPDNKQLLSEITEPYKVSGFIEESKAKSLSNLRVFKKGVSGNPTGRPKGFAELRHGILEFYQKRPQEAIRRLYRERIDLFFAYAFGKPADRVELSGPDGGAIEVQQMSIEMIAIELQKRGVNLPQ